ncbi:hypothetical protein C1646_812135 [Rhizophagus diaphanus]|nr:hypothetical protein C1646_812135 [Rhizophagus diaphanus] [Rhizophagus sp. MUCL 43196]
MACSKIFSGDLPELIQNEIIQYFRKDFQHYPFSSKNHHFIEIYLSKLNKDVKTKLYKYGINNNLVSSNTLLFNYPSFIKYLNINKILISIQTWVDTVVSKNQRKIVNLISRSLLEMFIENEGNLHSFEVYCTRYFDIHYFYDNLDLILQNPNLTYNIKSLTFRINGNSSTQNIIKLLKFLYSNCNSISSMVIDYPINDIYYPSLIEKLLSQIIISQHNLRKISFEFGITIYSPFLSLKNSNCSNTLNTIIFYYTDFKNIIKVLYVESLYLLLEKFSDYLENFGFGPKMFNKYYKPKQQLFEFITKYCKKIKYFESGIPADNNIYLFIENNQHNINYLTIKVGTVVTDYYKELSSTVLQNLGQSLPSKLEYLCLSLSFNINDLEIFLKNSQNTFIKKLLINNIMMSKCDYILFCMKKYIMKKERVKYLAISQTGPSGYNIIDLYLSKYEINEYKLHNIIVQPYNDLRIDIYSFINNNYLQY